jgi:hypothetical protein
VSAEREEQIKAAIEQLSPEEAQFFLHRLEYAMKKRRLQLTGYLVSMFVWLIGMVLGLAYFGSHDGFTGWVFLAPFAVVGLILWLVGKYANRVGETPFPGIRKPE